MKILKAIFVTVLVLLLANSPALADCSGDGTVSIVVKNHDTTLFDIKEVPWIKGGTVRVAMLNATNKEPSFKFGAEPICPYGDYVTEIGGVQPEPHSYWALSINGQPSEGGIDTAILQDGDTAVWEIQPELRSSNSSQNIL